MKNKYFSNKRPENGPFVYRLGHVVFILERGFDSPRDRHFMYYVYLIVTKKSNKLISYVGYTNNIKKIELHNRSKGLNLQRSTMEINIF